MVRQAAKLLLVDDDPSLLKLLGMRLRSEGYQVTTAASGPEALRLLQKEKIELVISDLRMDEMDGLALFGEIQKRHTGLPVIILTAHGSIPDAVSATQQGVFSFLTKRWIKMRSTKRLMKHWLSRRQSAMTAGGKRSSPAAR